MKMRDLKELGADRLTARIAQLAKELRQLREDVNFGKEKNHAKITLLKRDVARAKTALRDLSTKQ